MPGLFEEPMSVPQPKKMADINRLTIEKVSDIERRTDYVTTGFVLTDKDGKVCIVDKGAVRWLSSEENWNLMHPDSDSNTDSSK